MISKNQKKTILAAIGVIGAIASIVGLLMSRSGNGYLTATLSGSGTLQQAGRDVIIHNPPADKEDRMLAESKKNTRYSQLKITVRDACQEFRKGVLKFAGYDNSFYRNNIHSVPDFPFGLLDTIQSESELFAEKEGDKFLIIMGNFSRMKQGYEQIQRTKSDNYAATHFDWYTKTWHNYYKPAVVICEWAGIPMDDIKPIG